MFFGPSACCSQWATVVGVTVEPRNAASDFLVEMLSNWSDRQYVETELAATLTGDFVREDCRRPIGFPQADAQTYASHVLAYFDLENGQPTFTVEAHIAVRGERLDLSRTSVSYAGGATVEHLSICQTDESGQRCQKVFLFGVDDVEAATAKLDQLHAALEAD
jgi:hypothetical protein